MPAAIETRGLEKNYGDVQALDGIDIEVDEGDFFGLLGPNGAGKTTFINVLVGLVKKTGGDARVFGYDVEEEYRMARRKIGLAPQEFNVDRFFPIKEVLVHQAGYHGIPKGEAKGYAEDALKTVGIYDKRDTRFHWLSGGMKRRFMLARAMVTDPDLLILDEPTAGVDVQLRHDLWEIITRLNQEGTTILLTTHYIEEAEKLCDKVAIMDRGRKVEVATPEELMGRGLDSIYVTTRHSPEDAEELILDVEDDKIREVEVRDGDFVVKAKHGGSVVPDLVRAVENEGYDIVDIDIVRTSLEEVFVDMTESGGDTTR
ncbi:MAG: ABC transporter ATP-binding protein [Halobacteria archaeon]